MSRLPVYVIIDCSSSLSEEQFSAAQSCIASLVNVLCKDSVTLKTACISIITCGRQTEQILPLTEISAFVMPDICQSGKADFGQAIEVLASSIDKDLIKSTVTMKGDWPPIVFFFTNGDFKHPTEEQLSKLKKLRTHIIVFCISGDKTAPADYEDMADNVLDMALLTSADLKAQFRWPVYRHRDKATKEETNQDVLNQLPPPPDLNIII